MTETNIARDKEELAWTELSEAERRDAKGWSGTEWHRTKWDWAESVEGRKKKNTETSQTGAELFNKAEQ